MSARGSACLLGALALGASFACSSSDDPPVNPGSAGKSSGAAGAAAGGAPAVAGAPAGGSPAVAGAGNTGGTIGVAGAGASGGSSAGAGNAGSGGTAAGGAAAGGASGAGVAGSSTAGTGGGGGSGTYAPCPTTGPCKILPFGDSITFGLGFNGGYRVELFSKAVAANQNITFLGSQSNGPAMVAGKPFPPKNEGHSGWTIDPGGGSPGGISTLVPSPGFTTIPDIVLLMIGTNDATKSLTAQQITDNLGKLIDKVIMTAPNALVVVGKITPLSSAQAKIDTYNGNIPGLVQTRAAAGKHIVLADHSNLKTSDLGDGVHPNQGGYAKMAENWYSVIKTYLPTGT